MFVLYSKLLKEEVNKCAKENKNRHVKLLLYKIEKKRGNSPSFIFLNLSQRNTKFGKIPCILT